MYLSNYEVWQAVVLPPACYIGKEKAVNRKKIKFDIVPYLFLSPWIIGFIAFSGLPILISFALSLTSWNMSGKIKFIGFHNFKSIFQLHSSFWVSLRVTLIFTLFSVLLTMLWSLMMATILNSRIWFKKMFQFFFFLCAVLPTVALGFAFQLMLNSEIGIVNYWLKTFFAISNPPNWLTDRKWSLVTVIIFTIFTYGTGQMMLVFSSALKEVPQDLYESASLDGANGFQKYMHITLPAISPILLFNMVVAGINSLNGAFSSVFPVTGGGPDGATRVLSLQIYESAFKNYKMGIASSQAIVLFIIALIISLVQFAMSKKWVHYEN